MVILTDNIGATFIARHPIPHIKFKHVVLDLHFVLEKIEKGDLVVKHINGKDQWVDLLTKELPGFLGTTNQTKLRDGAYWTTWLVGVDY